MGTEYKGSSLQVFFNSVELSGQGRTITVSESPGSPEQIDITHRGDTERQLLESYPGAQVTTVDTGGLDESTGTAVIYDFAMNALDTLYVYPEGKTDTYREGVLQNARLIDRGLEVPYDGAVEWSATFEAKNSITWGTYSSA